MFWWTENARLKQQVQELQNELGLEQGQAARIASFLTRLLATRTAPDAPFSPRTVAEAALDTLHGLLQSEQALFLTYDSKTEDFGTLAARGLAPQLLSGLRVKQIDELKSKLSGPALMQLLIVQGRPLGILAVARSQGPAFSALDQNVFTLAAQDVALLYSHEMLQQEFGALRTQTVEALTRALGAKDTYTHVHARRTRLLTRAIAQELALPPALVELMEAGALLHDIGKIGIDDTVLKKAGPLSPEETKHMKTHSRLGKEILEPVQALSQVAAIVHYHQEWYNGNGYPEGLAGEEIPLGARVVQILDAWGAMTSNRPYRQAMPKAQAIAELRRQAGTQFDPKLVDVFLRVVDRLEREGFSTTDAAAQSFASKPA